MAERLEMEEEVKWGYYGYDGVRWCMLSVQLNMVGGYARPC